MTHLKVGDKAPYFEGINQDGEKIDLTTFSGKNLILYFYPKDNTPGCTTQACTYRDAMPTYTENNIKVFGISKDDLKSHVKFESDFDLNFELLSDESKEVIQAYGVWVEKNMYGNKTMGVERTTFVIDPDGKVAQIFRKVDPKLDSEIVLKSILG
jgi:peroxiredoxin Q/BCP